MEQRGGGAGEEVDHSCSAQHVPATLQRSAPDLQLWADWCKVGDEREINTKLVHDF
jgi:hypothetical protein